MYVYVAYTSKYIIRVQEWRSDSQIYQRSSIPASRNLWGEGDSRRVLERKRGAGVFWGDTLDQSNYQVDSATTVQGGENVNLTSTLWVRVALHPPGVPYTETQPTKQHLSEYSLRAPSQARRYRPDFRHTTRAGQFHRRCAY